MICAKQDKGATHAHTENPLLNQKLQSPSPVWAHLWRVFRAQLSTQL